MFSILMPTLLSFFLFEEILKQYIYTCDWSKPLMWRFRIFLKLTKTSLNYILFESAISISSVVFFLFLRNFACDIFFLCTLFISQFRFLWSDFLLWWLLWRQSRFGFIFLFAYVLRNWWLLFKVCIFLIFFLEYFIIGNCISRNIDIVLVF